MYCQTMYLLEQINISIPVEKIIVFFAHSHRVSRFLVAFNASTSNIDCASYRDPINIDGTSSDDIFCLCRWSVDVWQT